MSSYIHLELFNNNKPFAIREGKHRDETSNLHVADYSEPLENVRIPQSVLGQYSVADRDPLLRKNPCLTLGSIIS